MEKNNQQERNEIWIVYDSYFIPKYNYEIHAVVHSDDLKITLTDYEENKNVEIYFSGYYPAYYRYTDNTFRSRTWSNVNEQNAMSDKSGVIYIVKNSKLLQWFSEESQAVSDFPELTHYCIVTDKNVVDVLSADKPRIELNNSEYNALS